MGRYVIEDEAPAAQSGRYVIEDDTAPEKPGTFLGMDSGKLKSVGQGIGNLVAGAVRGAGSIGSTIIAPYDIARDAMAGKGLTLESNRQRRADIDGGLKLMGADPESALYGAGKITGEIAGTAGAGGALANVAGRIPALARAVPGIETALRTGGLKLGAPAAKTASELARNAATRIGAGALGGGAMAGMVDPGHAKTGALIGGLLPPAMATAGTLGRAAKSALIDPLVNQKAILGNTLARAVGMDNIPAMAVKSTPKTPGVAYTSGQQTGNPALLAFEDTLRSINPGGELNAQALKNNAALANTMRGIAQDDIAIEAAKRARESAVAPLYDRAKKAVIQDDGTLAELLKRPSMKSAMRNAVELAKERGEYVAQRAPATPISLLENGSISGKVLHDLKLGLDDAIGSPGTGGLTGEKLRSSLGTKDGYAAFLESKIPEYAEAAKVYASNSRPINQMKVGQLLANKLIPPTAGDVPSRLNAASFASALRNPDQVAKTATGFKGARLDSIMDSDQLASIRGVGADAGRIADTNSLGAGYGSPTARRQSLGNFVGENLANEFPITSKVMGLLGNVPIANIPLKAAGAAAGAIGGKINQKMAGELESLLANNPQAIIRLLNDAQRNYLARTGAIPESAISTLIRAGLITSANP